MHDYKLETHRLYVRIRIVLYEFIVRIKNNVDHQF